MTLNLSTLIQGLVWIAAVLDYVLPFVTDKWKPRVTVAAGIVSLTLHQYAGRRNPDGTDARGAYQPKAVPPA